MNKSIIVYILGCILILEAALMALPLLVAAIYRESSGFAFLATIAGCLLCGVPMIARRHENVFYAREGFVAVALGWIILSVGGAVPFFLAGAIPNFIDAFFETVSGFTTTGASILPAVEGLPHCILFWRSLTHWIGGMGVLVFVLTLMPQTGGYSMNLMKAESPGPSVSRLVPKVRSTAKILYCIYLVMTVMEVALLLIGRMPLFDTLCISFGTAGTGGFGILNDSCASYTLYQQWVITIFMILFGVNFNVYFLILMKKFVQAIKVDELRYYLGIIGGAILIITLDLVFVTGERLSIAFSQASFQVGSIITTTGFSTVDFNVWPMLSKTLLVLLMFCGACAGSTGGGIKVSRFIILGKQVSREFHRMLHPNSVKKIKMDEKPIPDEVVQSTNVYMVIYAMVFALSVILIALDNLDFTTNFTAVAATLNNIGPGLDGVGPAANFAAYSPFSKLILSVDMLAGRLELYPLFILFMPRTWKKFG